MQYLPDELLAMVGARGGPAHSAVPDGAVAPGSVVPAVAGPRQPLAGVVRCELVAAGVVADATARADCISATLPRYASEPHKDPSTAEPVPDLRAGQSPPAGRSTTDEALRRAARGLAGATDVR
jgi:hypothetical protein